MKLYEPESSKELTVLRRRLYWLRCLHSLGAKTFKATRWMYWPFRWIPRLAFRCCMIAYELHAVEFRRIMEKYDNETTRTYVR